MEIFWRKKSIELRKTSIHKEEMWYNVDNRFLRVVEFGMIRTVIGSQQDWALFLRVVEFGMIRTSTCSDGKWAKFLRVVEFGMIRTCIFCKGVRGCS